MSEFSISVPKAYSYDRGMWTLSESGLLLIFVGGRNDADGCICRAAGPANGARAAARFGGMILMALCAVLCGADTWMDVAEWAEDNETRQALWVTDLSWLDPKLRKHWPKLAGVGMIERQREINGTVSMERSFYIGSKGITTAESFAKTVRGYWGIENSLHWVLDVTFREDDCRVRKDHAPHNFAALRKFALALLRQDTQYPKRSLRSRRKTAERIPDYRASLLGLTLRG